MRTALAGLFVIALVGCPEEAPATSGVCEAQYGDGHLCYEIEDGGITDEVQCDPETSTFVDDTACVHRGYTELCEEESGFVVYGDSPETCAALAAEGLEKPERDP